VATSSTCAVELLLVDRVRDLLVPSTSHDVSSSLPGGGQHCDFLVVKALNGGGDLVQTVLDSEVSGIQPMDLGVGQVSQICFTAFA